MSLKGSNQLRSKIHVKLGKNYFYDVHHEYHEVLDYGGTPCNNDKTYQMDACNYNGTKKKFFGRAWMHNSIWTEQDQNMH